MLEIKKLGAKNFFHYWVTPNKTYKYSASDLVAVVSNNKFILRSVSGRVIFEKEGFSLNQIKVYDIDGSAETFASFEALTQRLIDLGYTAYDISYIEIQDEIDSFQGEIDAKTSKGGYIGTSQDLKDAIDNAIFGELVTYQTLAEFNAVSPVPADGTPFVVANDPNDANNGYWSVAGGVAVQSARTVENAVVKTNTTKGVTGEGISDALELKADLTSDSINLFNPNDENFLDDYVLDTNGVPVPNTTKFTTGYIRVNEGDVIYNGWGLVNDAPVRFIYGYNIYKEKIDGSEDSNRDFYVVPSNVRYVRLSANDFYNNYQINKGSLKPYTPYDLIQNINPEYIGDNAITTSKITDESVIESKTNFFEPSINIFNPNADDVELGYYVDYATGIVYSNPSFNLTGYISVNELDFYTLSYKHQIAWFNEDKVYISGSNNVDTNKTQQAPLGATFLRCSVRLEFWDEFQVELGSTQSAYVPYGFSLKDKYLTSAFANLGTKQFESKLGQDGQKLEVSSLTSGNISEISEFPYHIKKGVSLSMSAKFSSFTNHIEFGKGFEQYRGAWLKIDNTNLSWLRYESTTTTEETIAHGLTLDTFVKCSLYVDDNSVAYVILQTLNGYFSTTFQWNFEFNFKPFIKTTGQTITDVTLNATCKDFQNSVWAFGDSYFGVANNRWVGVMKNFGFFNFMINGLAGQVSSGAYNDLLRSLNFGTPKYLLWCLGMNDSDANHLTEMNKVISKCEALGITLILATIPTVPTRDKETITANVIATGKRYIDFYNAVGANSSGVWYTDYLSVDGVHPDPIGAEALAMQVLIDFPELMQYGLNSPNSIANDLII